MSVTPSLPSRSYKSIIYIFKVNIFFDYALQSFAVDFILNFSFIFIHLHLYFIILFN